uniref:CopG family transcriptional regulator n=1 Tax=Archaeoglobus fulgidus TaxID=2234 RepID=A0A7J3M2Y1_ARCFL
MEVGKMRRLTISLDDDTITKLEELAEKDGRSLSEVVRAAIANYYDLSLRETIPNLRRFLDLISSREYVVIDIGLWAAIADEINEKADEVFWETVEKVGFEHGLQFKEMGLKDVHSVLKLLEVTNWFKVRVISESVYGIVLTTRNEVKLVKKFLDGVFKSMGLNVEFSEGLRKLLVKRI